MPKNSFKEQWEIDLLKKEIFRIYGLHLNFDWLMSNEKSDEKACLDFLNLQISNLFHEKEQKYDPQTNRLVEKQIFLITLDNEWKDHLHSLDKLRQSINLRAFAQKDPLIEYKKEGFNLFQEMMLRFEEQFVSRIAHVEISSNASNDIDLISSQSKIKTIESRAEINSLQGDFNLNKDENIAQHSPMLPIRNRVDPSQRKANDPLSWGVVGRNEACPCGSGKKYKNCHGLD